MPEVAVICPYRDLSISVSSLCKARGLRVKEFDVHTPSEGAAVATSLDPLECRVIISRGKTAQHIRRATSIPVVSIPFSSYDVTLAIFEARKAGFTKVTVVHHEEQPFSREVASEMLRVEIEERIFHSPEEIPGIIKEIAQAGYSPAVVGGSQVENLAAENGLRGFLIKSSEASIDGAVYRAQEVMQEYQRQQEMLQWVQSVLNNIKQGVLVVDREGRLVTASAKARSHLGISAADDGEMLKRLPKSVSEVLRTGQARKGVVEQFGRSKLFIDTLPVRVSGNLVGCVCTFQDVVSLQNDERKVRNELMSQGLVARYSFDDIIGESPAIREAVRIARRYAATDSTVLIRGESGTGKELFAHSIHQASTRRDRPFVAINCATLPESLLESELFGYEGGAFTGASRQGKAGLFEIAHGGTIFLDEIESVSPKVQASLLRVIEYKQVMRIGGTRLVPVDVRIIAATNQDLAESIRRQQMRQDLYFRLKVLTLDLPPLRERGRDVELLAEYFANQYGREYGKETSGFWSECESLLTGYSWPGNVRELMNITHSCVLLSEENPIKRDMVERTLAGLKQEWSESAPGGSEDTITVRVGSMKDMESQVIRSILERTKPGQRSALARRLGISRATLWRKARDLGVSME